MRFAKKGKGVGVQEAQKKINLAGGEAFVQEPELEFASILLTSFVQDQFYRSEGAGTERITQLMDILPDPSFAAKAAIYARGKFGMRSVSHIVAGEIGKRIKNVEWSREFFRKVVHRPDDITEILAYYMSNYGRPIPNSMKRGLGDALGKFDEYQLAKWRGEGGALKLIDAVNLIHPKPTDKNRTALEKLVKDKLKSKGTWETGLTQAGQKAETEEEKKELKKETWEDLIKNRKIGYFALLRNLRNIKAQAEDVLPEALAMLKDKVLIKKSLVLPFRYLTAYQTLQEMQGMEDILEAIQDALEISFDNVPKFEGRTLVAFDSSQSMWRTDEPNSPFNIGTLFALALVKSNNADLMLFTSEAKYMSLIKSTPTFAAVQIIRAVTIPENTNFHNIFRVANQKYDRIVIISDMQGWGENDPPTAEFENYKRRHSASPHIFSLDLAGFGTLQFPQNKVYCMAGFSEKVFDIFKMLETDRSAMINTIKKVELNGK